MNKKRVITGSVVLVALAVAVLVCVLLKKQRNAGEEIWITDFTWNQFSDAGVLHHENGFLYFYDADSGIDSLICTNPTCSHGREECSASFPGWATAVRKGEKLYVLTSGTTLNEKLLYETDLDGSNRKLIRTFDTPMQAIRSASFDGERLLIAYLNFQDENNDPLAESVSGVCLYDMAEDKERVLFQEQMFNAIVMNADFLGEQAAFTFFGYSVTLKEALENEGNPDFFDQHIICELYLVSLQDSTLQKIASCRDCRNIVKDSGCVLFLDEENRLWSYELATRERQYVSEEAFSNILSYGGEYLIRYAEDGTKEIYEYDGELQYIGKLREGVMPAAITPGRVYYYEFVNQYEFDETFLHCDNIRELCVQ